MNFGSVRSARVNFWGGGHINGTLWYVVVRVLATTMMRPNAIVCGKKCFAKLFSVWKLQIWPVTDLCKIPVSCWWPTASWATETALFWQDLCLYPLIYPSNECNWSSSRSALIGTSHKLRCLHYTDRLSTFSTSWWMQTGPATRSVVATW